MKVTDPWKKLLAALAAGGMFASSTGYAANFNQNVVVNGGFENVDPNTLGSYHGPKILDWTVGVVPGFAYSHDGSTTTDVDGTYTIPNYADGTPPPNAGHWYLSTNNAGGAAIPRIDAPGKFYQDINVSTGDTGDLIRTGGAKINLSAYMSSYLNDADFGSVHADFRNSQGVSLGTTVINDSDPGPANVWNLNTGSATIPAGTATVRVSVYGTKVGPGDGGDGYVDNVDVQLTVPSLALVVNRANGNISLKNFTNSNVNLSAYSITSAFEAMSTTSWLSIADNYDSGNPGANQVDSAHAWSKLTSPTAHTDLSEADLQTGLGATLANNKVINLGNGDWIQNPNEDLVFQYISDGQIKTGLVAFIGNNNLPFASGDLNVDGFINTADWAILRTNQLTNLSSNSLAQAYRLGDLTGDKLSNHADFVAFKSAYDVANGAGSFVAMLASTAVPEPSSALLILAAGTFILPALRRRSTR